MTLLAILASDAIALPMAPSFPASELRYIINNSEAVALLASAKFKSKAEEVLKEGFDKPPALNVLEKRMKGLGSASKPILEPIKKQNGGMMLYTSGTTNRPVDISPISLTDHLLTIVQKGVLLPEAALTAQALSLKQAWNYSPSDHLLHVLPLHHVHGTVNALYTPLFSASTIEFLFPFNATSVWERLAAPFTSSSEDATLTKKEPITFLTVVPTIYNRLFSSFSSLAPEIQGAAKKGISPSFLRLNISGSAALPTPTKSAWTELSSGNVLLERYGMTEVGMALSCGLDFDDRVDGSVGWPLPSVEARLVDTETHQVIPLDEEVDSQGKEREGEIQLRGPTVFKEYWRNPKATTEEFVEGEDGKGRWFKTGDVACRKTVEGAGKSGQEWAKGPMYFIRGRSSVDIIKTGGEKVSALEVERELLSLCVESHSPNLLPTSFVTDGLTCCSRPQISEAAVVGLPSDQWGQKVAAVVVLNPSEFEGDKKTWSVMDMRRALKDRLVNYKIPQELKVLQDGLPRNAMGKINKKSLVKEVWGDGAKAS